MSIISALGRITKMPYAYRYYTNNLLGKLTAIVFLLFPLCGFSSSSISQIESQSALSEITSSASYLKATPRKIFDKKFEDNDINDLSNIDYKSSYRQNGAEWRTQFDAENHISSDEDDSIDLGINTFYISYFKESAGISSKIGRQASPGGGVVGRMDGVSLRMPLISQVSLGVSAGFPVNSWQKNQIQSNKPFVALNVKLPGIYKSLALKPYVVMQNLDGFLNRQSLGSEINYTFKRSTFYQLTDYDLQFNEMNMWLLQGQLLKRNKTLYHMVLDYRRNPALDLDNALINEYRVYDLKGLSTILSKKDMLSQANDRTARNYSAKFGSSFPLNSRIQLGADLERRDQVFKTKADTSYLLNHDFQNELSTQLVVSNLLKRKDTLLFELGYVDAKNFTNSSLSIRNQLRLSGLYKLDVKLNVAEGAGDNGEILVSTLPTAKLSCQCSKRLNSEFEVGYENWNFTGNTLQEDYSQLFASIQIKLDL